MVGFAAANSGKLVVEGLKLFVPAGSSAVVRERMAHLDSEAAKWELYELEERREELKPMEILDCGNILTRLVHCPEEAEINQRFRGPIALVRSLMSEAELAALSPAEISFRRHGLEFARSRLSAAPGHSAARRSSSSAPAPRSECSMTETCRILKP